jgi:fibro-slime domain-containing protein
VLAPGNEIVGGSDVIEEPTGPQEPGSSGTNSDCDNVLEVTYRDFNEDHPDFEMPFQGDVVRLNLVSPSLDAEGKPVFSSSIGCPQDHEDPRACGDWEPEQVSINSADSFAQWYRTTPGVNEEFQKSLTLSQASPGVYVYDSDQFFPLGPEEGFGVSPRGHHMGENFLFTTEIHLLFTYQLGQKFSFKGDDDLWIFINGKLALDLGSMHNVATGEIDFDAQADALGIVPNRQYPMDVFHAERHTSASNFRIETNIACFLPGTPRIR